MHHELDITIQSRVFDSEMLCAILAILALLVVLALLAILALLALQICMPVFARA